MKQRIVGFRQDLAGDWIAGLACGHALHVRHNPPWQLRPWVLTAPGREAMLGRDLDCSLCDAASQTSPDDPATAL